MSGKVAANLFTVAIVLAVGFQVATVATSGEMATYVNESGEWCDERGGELYNARVIGPHGGLHCDLPNGTSVHMSDVIEVNGSG